MIKKSILQAIGGILVLLLSLLVFSPALAAAPKIEGWTLTTQRGGGWVYKGDSDIKLVVDTDANTYSVACDFSSVPPSGTTKKATATANGDTTYTCTQAVPSTTDQGGGVAIITAVNTSTGETTVRAPSFPTGANEFPDTSSATGSPMIMMNINPKTMTPPDDPKFKDFKMGADTTDFSAITNFKKATITFHIQKSGKDIVKFTFTEVDMTDFATLKNMFQIFQLMESAVDGKFKYDPATQSVLKNAKASMTLFGLPDTYVSDPEILVDGKSEDVGTVTFSSSAKSVTFTAPHFSEFAAVPKITIDSPSDGAKVSTTEVTVKGSVSDSKAKVTIVVNDKDQGDVTVGSDGKFEKKVTLTKKENTITVDASNDIGKATQKKLTVTSSALPATGTSTAVLWALVLIAVLGLSLVGLSFALPKKAERKI